jgi:hypothetical protein
VDLDWREYVKSDPRYMRPMEVDHLEGDATKAHKLLGWLPTTSFDELVRMMVDADWDLARQEIIMRSLIAALKSSPRSVSLFDWGPFLRPDLKPTWRRAQPRPMMAVGHRRRRREASLTAVSPVPTLRWVGLACVTPPLCSRH